MATTLNILYIRSTTIPIGVTMNETNGNLRDRVSRIEDGYEHLATKADLKVEVAELRSDIARFKAEFCERIDKLEARLLLRCGGILVAAIFAAVGFSRLLP